MQYDSTTHCVNQNLVNCCTTVGTSCRPTANHEQVEIMELYRYSRPMCNKLYASNNDALIVIGVIYKLDR